MQADDAKRHVMAATLNVRQIRNHVMHIVQAGPDAISNEMAHQLHVLQVLGLEKSFIKILDATILTNFTVM